MFSAKTKQVLSMTLLAHTVLLLALTAPEVAAETSVRDDESRKSTNFNDGSLGPFSEDHGYTGRDIFNEGMSFQNDGYGGKRLKLTWQESEYDGSREERGHELKLNVVSNYEIYCGYHFYVPPASNARVTYPDDKSTIVWQLYNWNTAGCSNWAAHLTIDNNALKLSYRQACVDATTVTVLENIPRNQNMEIRIRARAGRGTGRFDIYVDNDRKVRLRNIDLGFGEFDSRGRMETSVIGVKMGIYAADVDGYSQNEVRPLYFDNVSVAKDRGWRAGMRAVNPDY